MFSYSDILRRAYHITKRHVALWVFGLFVIGTFNINFLRFSGLLSGQSIRTANSLELLGYFQDHPGRLALFCLSVLWVAALSLILTNWSRVMLLLLGQAAIEKRYDGWRRQVSSSWRLLWPVIVISLLTSLLMFFVLAVLLAPLWVADPQLQGMLWVLGLMVFLVLAFTISCLNIFITMFVVVLRLPLGRAVDAATDFFVAHWAQILGLTSILAVIYLFCFGVGVGVLGLVKLLAQIILLDLRAGGALHIHWIFTIIKFLTGLLLWLLLGGLNAFLNVALLLFFGEKIKPLKSGEGQAAELIQPSPAPMS
ncbi:MAG: hypothetical protein KGJ93_02600 [Patescibacteria group bacterium]|nr:hypothetical protein [Patescibacteria group bacterium]